MMQTQHCIIVVKWHVYYPVRLSTHAWQDRVCQLSRHSHECMLTRWAVQAQVMTEKAAQPRLSHARRSSVKALPVMFFGTLEVAWLAEKDMVSWSQGLKDKLWDKGRKREAFVLAVQQVAAACIAPCSTVSHLLAQVCL